MQSCKINNSVGKALFTKISPKEGKNPLRKYILIEQLSKNPLLKQQSKVLQRSSPLQKQQKQWKT